VSNDSSLSKQEEFVPVNAERANWYTYGSTVNSESHMGHACTYVSFDILRRSMTEQFGFYVKMRSQKFLGP